MPSKKTSTTQAESGADPDMVVRSMTPADLDAIVALNKAAYPTLAEDNVVWARKHVESHLRVFPEGQIVVEHKGQIVAAASTLVVHLGRDDYRNHTWSGITDNGFFTNHDPDGDSLYGADVCVHPDFRRRGLGALLYVARRELCQKLNLRRIVLGGRLYDYGKHAKDMSAEEYARRVEAGDLRDLVLSFQLTQGFTLRKVMPNYLRDRRSRDYGSFLEWMNPKYKPRPTKERKVRVSCVQYRQRRIRDFEGFAQQVTYFVDVASNYGSDFVIFPELLTVQLMSFIEVKTPIEAIRRLTGYTQQVNELFTRLAKHYQICILGGSHPVMVSENRIENIASLYLPNGTMFHQSKLHVTPNERRWWGIEGGNSIQVIETPKAKVGIVICYDVEFPETARVLADQGAEIILVPFCTDDRQSYLRVRYCAQARAVENLVYLALSGNVGNLPDVENMDIQYAQSCVLAPSDFPFARDGIQVESAPNTEGVITCDLNLDLLSRAIHDGTVTPRLDRRGDLFKLQVAKPS